VARAKRTERAERRRRYRAYLAELAARETEEGEEAEEREAGASRRETERTARDATPKLKPGQRLGFLAAAKAATRQVHYVEDLRYTPTLVMRTHAIWVPTVIAVAASAIAIQQLNGATVAQAQQNAAVQLAIGFVLNPAMPMLPALLAGFFAPRATWLAGVIVSFVTTIAYFAVVADRPELFLQNVTKLAPGDLVLLAGSAMALSLPFGAMLAAFSGWYKRFLELSGPGAALAQQRAAAGQKTNRRQAATRRPAR
jgi:hypothetical protein